MKNDLKGAVFIAIIAVICVTTVMYISFTETSRQYDATRYHLETKTFIVTNNENTTQIFRIPIENPIKISVNGSDRYLYEWYVYGMYIWNMPPNTMETIKVFYAVLNPINMTVIDA